jgi:Lon-like ATP-dependent protease
LSCSR